MQRSGNLVAIGGDGATVKLYDVRMAAAGGVMALAPSGLRRPESRAEQQESEEGNMLARLFRVGSNPDTVSVSGLAFSRGGRELLVVRPPPPPPPPPLPVRTPGRPRRRFFLLLPSGRARCVPQSTVSVYWASATTRPSPLGRCF